jgi:hypothetical protein
MQHPMTEIAEGDEVFKRIQSSLRPWRDVMRVRAPIGGVHDRGHVAANLASVPVPTSRGKTQPPPITSSVHDHRPIMLVIPMLAMFDRWSSRSEELRQKACSLRAEGLFGPATEAYNPLG